MLPGRAARIGCAGRRVARSRRRVRRRAARAPRVGAVRRAERRVRVVADDLLVDRIDDRAAVAQPGVVDVAVRVGERQARCEAVAREVALVDFQLQPWDVCFPTLRPDTKLVLWSRKNCWIWSCVLRKNGVSFTDISPLELVLVREVVVVRDRRAHRVHRRGRQSELPEVRERRDVVGLQVVVLLERGVRRLRVAAVARPQHGARVRPYRSFRCAAGGCRTTST